MADPILAMKGRIGTMEYYALRMKISEVITRMRMPSEFPGWKHLTLEEKWQRQFNEERIKTEIAPYFATEENRFSSALIAAIHKDGGMTAADLEKNFEPIASVITNDIPQAYRSNTRNLGFLNLGKAGEFMYPIDGQHRLSALRMAADGYKDDDGNEIQPNTALGNEDIIVIAIPYGDGKAARMIFNKVNKYAKPTSQAQNLLTDDDHILPVITREMTRAEWTGRDEKGLKKNEFQKSNPYLLSADSIDIENSNLTPKSGYFTTIETFNRINSWVLLLGGKLKGDDYVKAIKNYKFTPEYWDFKPADDKQIKTEDINPKDKQHFKNEIARFWKAIIGKIDLVSQALEDRGKGGNETRQRIRKESVLGKPMGQQTLARAYLLLTNYGDPKPITEDEACKRLNNIPWSVEDRSIWDGTLISPTGNRTVTSSKAAPIKAGMLVAYLCGYKMKDDDKKWLRDQIAKSLNREEDYELPNPLF